MPRHRSVPGPHDPRRPVLAWVTGLAVVLGLAACSDSGAPSSPAAQAGAGAPPPPEVLVEIVQPQRVVVKAELPGRVQALRTAEVRARVEGIIQRRAFREGSEVKVGDLLFQIDPARLQADQETARANVARAEADLSQAQLRQQRLIDLVRRKAVSQQDYDEAVAQVKRTEADVAAARAALARATIDLDYARVVAPITGRIGRALVTEGSLVGSGEATHLATIEQLDPIYVNFTQSRRDMLNFRKQAATSSAGDPDVTVLLEDGTPYALSGRLLFSEMTVDPGTGEVLLRAEIPNPERLLLPGMFVRVRVDQAVYEQAYTVSQRSLIRGPQGEIVMSVLPDGKVVPLPVQTERAQGDRWIIRSGLSGGEQIIVEGLQKVRPGAMARAVPITAPAVEAAAPAAN